MHLCRKGKGKRSSTEKNSSSPTGKWYKLLIRRVKEAKKKIKKEALLFSMSNFFVIEELSIFASLFTLARKEHRLSAELKCHATTPMTCFRNLSPTQNPTGRPPRTPNRAAGESRPSCTVAKVRMGLTGDPKRIDPEAWAERKPWPHLVARGSKRASWHGSFAGSRGLSSILMYGCGELGQTKTDKARCGVGTVGRSVGPERSPKLVSWFRRRTTTNLSQHKERHRAKTAGPRN